MKASKNYNFNQTTIINLFKIEILLKFKRDGKIYRLSLKRIRIEKLLKLFIVLDPLQIHVQRFVPEFDMGIGSGGGGALLLLPNQKNKKKKKLDSVFCSWKLENGHCIFMHACMQAPGSCQVIPFAFIDLFWGLTVV